MFQGCDLLAGKREVKKPGGVRGFFRKLYKFIVAVSVIIVAGYGLGKVFIQPPAIASDIDEESTMPTQNDSIRTTTVTSNGRARREGVYNFLIVGSDDGNGNTDTIMVCSFDTAAGTIGILSIPRDTAIDYDQSGKTMKINSVFSRGGIEQLQDEVEYLLGVPIDHSCQIDLAGVSTLVDTLGGIDLYVPVNMYYHDPLQNLSIEFKQGWHYNLSGKDALKIIRFRKNDDGSGYADSDIGRTQMQQDFMKAVMKKIISWNSIPKITSLVDVFTENVTTTLKPTELIYLGTQALGLDTAEDISTGTLSGDGTVTYGGWSWLYVPYEDEALELVNALVNPYDVPLTLEDIHIYDPTGINS